MSAVRLAFVTSVANVPPDKFQRIHESIVPMRAVPAFTASATAGTLSMSHFILLAEKYGAIARPVRRMINSLCASLKLSMNSAVLVSCQTSAL